MQTMQALALGLFPLLPVENHFCDRRHQIATRAISCDRESRGIDVDFPTLLSSPPRCGVRFFNGNRIASLRDSRGPAERCGVRAVFFLVEVTAAKLNAIAEHFERGELVPHVGWFWLWSKRAPRTKC